MLASQKLDQRAWRATTIDDSTKWYYPFSERCRTAINQTVQQLRRSSYSPIELQLNDFPLAACADEFQPVLEALESGRGFAILEGLPVEPYSIQELQAIYWLVGQILGTPQEQNVQGSLLYDVRDTGQDVRYGARFSVTNAESTFHTDNAFGGVLDYVGLLCLKTAKSGGINQVVSAYAAHHELQLRHPEILEPLSGPFHFDRRGGVRPGEQATVQYPILSWQGDGLVCRYLRYWIETGHDKADAPLSVVQRQALDVLDSVLSERPLRVEFSLKPGDMFFINNRWILHNRTGFEDHAEPERRRHYVRLWLRRRSGLPA